METLESHIKSQIKNNGPMQLDEFITLALIHPEYGYYNTRDSIGASGDFITAPEISQMFGELLGLWAVVVWQQMGSPKKINLVEVGPGKGTLMADLLRTIKNTGVFKCNINTILVEISPYLRSLQKKTLCKHSVTWCNKIDDLPNGPSIIIANEFFDALPIQQLVFSDSKWYARQISISDENSDRFIFVKGPKIEDIDIPPGAPTSKIPDGAILEYSPEREKAASILAEHIAKQSGAALIIDYGYSLTTIGDTLQAVQDHKSSPVLSTPGAADITAHVDFESIYRATMNSKILFFGPISQRQFLTRIGIKTRASSLMSKATPENAEKTYSALMRLIAPELMGTMFKAVAIVGGNKFIPPGFDKVSNTLKHKHETIP